MKYSLILFVLLMFNHVSLIANDGFNLGQLREQARYMVRDTDSSNYRWGSTLLNERFAMAEEEFCTRTESVRTQGYIVTVTSQTEYSLPTGWIKTNRVSRAIKPLRTSTTRYTQIDYVTMDWLDNDKNRPYFEDSNPDVPQRYYINTFSRKIGLDPPPNVTYTGSNLIKHEYTIISSTMSSDTDMPFDDIEYLYPYHKALLYFVVSMCDRDSGKDQSAISWMQVFDAFVERARQQINDYLTDKKGSGFVPK